LAKKLVPDFSYTFDGKIWKTCTDAQNMLLALEIRDDNTHRVSFSILDIKTGKIIRNNLVVEEPWWTSIESIQWPVLYLRIFPDELNPSDINLLAFDIEKEQPRWIVEHFDPVLWGENVIIGRRTFTESREVCSINTISGVMTLPLAEMAGSDSLKYPGYKGIQLHYPVQYFEGDENFNIIKEFLGREKIKPRNVIDYLEFNELVIIGYYSPDDSDLANYLLITDMKGNIIFHKKCSTGLKGIGVELFFIMETTLIFTVEKTSLVCIKLE
jgi:hypothetical protein